MIKSVRILNFRCFEKLSISDFRRVNVIVGQNGSGKTALLEALFLAAGPSPEIALRLRQWRGFEAAITGFERFDEALWGDLFFGFNKSLTAEVHLAGEPQAHNRSFWLSYGPSSKQIPISSKKSTTMAVSAPIRFRWKTAGEYPFEAIPRIEDGKIKLEPAPPTSIEGYFFSSVLTYPTLEIATRFSDVSKLHQKQRLIDELKKHYPEIEDISLEISAGFPIVHASLKHLPRMLPINLVSGGMTKVAALLFTIASKNQSIVIVDEVENGIHHRLLTGLWKSFIDLCREHDSQVFVSTHSMECLNALADAIDEEAAESLSIIRIFQEDGVSSARAYSGDKALSAIRSGVEVRG